MSTETVLSDEEIITIGRQARAIEPGEGGYILPIAFARAIEQAVLNSPEVQALRKGAEWYQWMRDEADDEGRLTVIFTESSFLDKEIDAALAQGQGGSMNTEQERAVLQSQDREDALRYRFIRSIVSASNAWGRGSWQFHYDRLPIPLNNPTKGSVTQHFDEAIDDARRIEGEGE